MTIEVIPILVILPLAILVGIGSLRFIKQKRALKHQHDLTWLLKDQTRLIAEELKDEG